MTPDEQTRVFLARVFPWDDDGKYRSLWFGWHKPGADKPIFYGRPIDNIDHGVRMARFNADKGNEVYACMSVQGMLKASLPTDKGPRAAKSIEQAFTLNTFWLDVDVKPGGYASDRDAIVGINAFIKNTSLPRPNLIVHTGGGLHFHWVIDTPMPASTWQPLAEALKGACTAHKLPIDLAVIADAARLMRVPGTWNCKEAIRREVKILGPVQPAYPLALLQGPLKPYTSATPVNPTNNVGSLGAVSTVFAGVAVENLAAGIVSTHRSTPVDFDAVCRECPLFKDTLENHGQHCGNPAWNLIGLGSTFAPDGLGREWFHKLSSGWAGYNPATVDAHYNTKLKARGNDDRLGWPSCAKFSGTGQREAAICATCSWPSKGILSPLALGATDFDLPPGYKRKQGLIFRQVKNDSGEDELRQVTTLGAKDAYLEACPEGIMLHLTMVPPRSAEVKVTLPGKEISSITRVSEMFGTYGMPPYEWMRRELKELMVSWVAHLQNMKGAFRRAHAYGWAVHEGTYKGFAYNGRLFGPGDTEPTRSADRSIKEYYTPQGTMAPWKAAADFVTAQKRMDLDTIIAAAFGAPLVHFTGHSGMILSAQSQQSGVGKTSAMRIGAAVWGHPKSSMMQLDDTTNSTMHRLGQLRNLPIFWDEIKGGEQAKRFTAAAFQVAQGREKARMTQDVTMRDAGQWETMLLVASNEKIAARVAENTDTAAGVMRVLEWEVQAIPRTQSTVAASMIIGKTDTNFGHAGLVYAEFLGKHAPAVGAMVAKVMIDFENKLSASQEERFWVAAASCVYTGAAIARRLGLVDFDLPMLEQFLLTTIRSNRIAKGNTTSDLEHPDNLWDMLNFYISDRAGRVLHTDVFTTGGGRPAKLLPGYEPPKIPNVEVHFAHDLGIVRFDHASFTEWCQRGGHITSSLEGFMKRHYAMTMCRVVMGGGTLYRRNTQSKAMDLTIGSGRMGS